jgi:tetratricopeptide (TPR) repeat protein
MAKIGASPRSVDQLIQVAGFLRQADKLVRERDFSSALEQIAKARAKDPHNSYAEAYEQRVQLLLAALNERQRAGKLSIELGSSALPSMSQHLESIANLAILEAQRNASLSLKQEELERRRSEAESQKLAEIAANRSATESRQAALLQRALDHELNGQIQLALEEVSRAYVLDPTTNRFHELEERLKHTAPTVQNHSDNAQEDFVEEETLSEEQKEQLSRYVRVAEEMFRAGRHEISLRVLSAAVRIDPLNKSVLKLEQLIRDAQEQEYEATLEGFETQDSERSRTHDRMLKEIYEIVRKANRLAARGQYSEALDLVTQGYRLDPANTVLEDCEKQIISMLDLSIQKRRAPRTDDRAGEMYSEVASLPGSGIPNTINTKPDTSSSSTSRTSILDNLDKAQVCLSHDNFAEALAHVALALIATNAVDGTISSVHDVGRPQDRTNNDPPHTSVEQVSAIADDDKRFSNVRALLAQSCSLASTGSYPAALEVLAKAARLVSTGRSSADIEREIGRLFIEYNQLRENREQSIVAESTGKAPGALRNPWESEGMHVVNKHPDQVKEHILQTVRHLNQMRMVEALVEAGRAASLSESKKDVEFLKTAIERLCRQPHLTTPLNALGHAYTNIQKYAKVLIYKLCYDDLIVGIDRALRAYPSSDILRVRKMEAERSFQENTRTLQEMRETIGMDLDRNQSPNSPVPRERKRGLDQIGLDLFDNFAYADRGELNSRS